MPKKKKQKVVSKCEKFVSGALNIARHEWERVGLAFLIKLCFQIAFVASGTALLALFVERFSLENLPLLYILEALFVVIGTFIFSGLLRAFSVEKSLIFGSICAALLFGISLFVSEDSFAFFGIALAGFSVFLAQVGIWISVFIEEIFSPLEGERIFPLIEASEPIGGVLAGGLILTTLAFFDANEIILFAGAIVLAIAPILIFSLEKLRAVPHLHSEKEREKNPEKRREIWKNTIRFFRHSPFLTGLFVVIFLQFFAIHFLDFQFTKAVDGQINITESEHSHADLLTHSIGTIHIVIFGILLLVQLFLSGRLLQKIGVIRTFAAGPIASFFGFCGMLWSFSFGSAVIARGAFEIGNGIGKNAFGAAFYAMRENFRNEAKEFLEGVARPLGSLFGTILLFILQKIFGGDLLTTVFSSVLVVVAGVATILSLRLQKSYTLLSKKNLESRGNIEEKINAIEILSQPGHHNATDYLIRALSFRREIPELRIKILGTLGKLQDINALPALLKCFNDPDPAVRLAAVHALGKFRHLGQHFFGQSFSRFRIAESLKTCFSKTRQKELKIAAVKVFANIRDPEIVPLLIDLLSNPDAEIRAESVSIIGLFHDPTTIEFLEPLMEDPDPRVRGATIAVLWQFVPLRIRLVLEMTKMLESKNYQEILAGIDALGETKWEAEKPRLRKFLESSDEKIQHHAALALAKMNDESAVEHLFHFLFHEKKSLGQKTRKMLRLVHEDIRRTLRKKSLHEVARRISEILKKRKTNILEKLPSRVLIELFHLFSLIEAEREVQRIKAVLSERG